MKKKDILQKTEFYVRELMSNDISGHDWWHIYRVRKLALTIAEKEGGDKFIIELAALLHDVDDWKLGEKGRQSEKAKNWMESLLLQNLTIEKILEIIGQVSFKGNFVEDNTSSIEAKIVQDADRLDALGAIGIARAFVYGGSKGRLMFDPSEKPKQFNSFEEYKKGEGTTINHFYEKLLILKDRIGTPTGKIMAEERHVFMEEFLKHFLKEWSVEN